MGFDAKRVIVDLLGEQKSYSGSATGITHGSTSTINCTAVSNGKTGYLEQVVLSAQGGPTRALLKQDGSVIARFVVGGHPSADNKTGHIGGSCVWPCDFAGLFQIAGDGSKKWSVDFKNECGVAMTVDAHVTLVWREK